MSHRLPHTALPQRYASIYHPYATTVAPYATSYDPYYDTRAYSVLSAPDRLAALQGRVEDQERRMQMLMDNAARVQQELLENLSYAEGTWQDEKESRDLLSEHVETITAIVNQMDKEFRHLYDELRGCTTGILGNNGSLKQLGGHHVMSITDLRGRVGRLDAATAKIANEIRLVGDADGRQGNAIYNEEAKQLETIHNLSDRISDINSQGEKLQIDSKLLVKQLQELIEGREHSLESRLKSEKEELEQMTYSYVTHAKGELDVLESKLHSRIDTVAANMDKRMEKMAAEQREMIRSAMERLNYLEKDHAEYNYHVTQLYQILEQNLKDYADKVHQEMVRELTRLRNEMKDGFNAIHEATVSVRGLLEGNKYWLRKLCVMRWRD